MPRGHCYLWNQPLVFAHLISDLLIGLAYTAISLSLYSLVRKIRLPFSAMVLSFGVFIGACGATHFMEVLTLWQPQYWWSAGVKLITAFASVATGIWLVKLKPKILTLAEAAKAAKGHLGDLERQTLELQNANKLLRESEVRIRESESRLLEAQKIARVGSWQWDIPRAEITWSDELYRIFGVDKKNGPPGFAAYLERLHRDDRARVEKIIKESLETGQSFGFEHRTVLPGDITLSVYGRGQMVKDEQGKVVKMLGTAQDITEQKRREAERADLENFKQLAETIPQIVWSTDAAGAIEYYNQRWFEFTGLDSNQLGPGDWPRTIHPEDLQKVQTEYARSLRDENTFECEYRLRRHDGKYFWFLGRSIPVRNPSGEIVKRFGTATNIEAQKMNEKRLWQAQENSRFLAEAGAVLASSLDYDTTLQAIANLCVPRLADWCTIDVLEQTGPRQVAVAHPDPEKMKLVDEFKKSYPIDWQSLTGAPNVMRTGVRELYPRITDEMLLAASKSEKHYQTLRDLGMRSVLVVPLRGLNKTLGAITLIYAESHKAYSEEEIELSEELARRAGIAVENALYFENATRAIELRDEFLSIASHELKTPITSLKLQLQMAKRRISSPDLVAADSGPMLEKMVAVSMRQADRLTNLIEDLLNVSRIQAGKLSLDLENVNLNHLIHEVVDRLQEQLEEARSTVELQLAPELTGKWDPSRLDQVLVNLISNAIKYAPGKPIRIETSHKNERALIRVQDSGPGIPPEKHALIFERFERAIDSRHVSGLGLGLYIAKEIVESLEGTLHVESKVGQGACFVIELPLRRDEEIDLAHLKR